MKNIRILIALNFLLLSFWANPSFASENLIKACMKGDLAEVKLLVKKGDDVNFKDSEGKTPLSVSYFSPEICKFLIDNKADINGGAFSCLVNASRYGAIETIKILLNAGADPNGPALMRVSGPLEKMVANEKAKGEKANTLMIKSMEEQIIRLQEKAVKIYPMFYAVIFSNCLECMEVLIEKGARADEIIPMTGGNFLNEFATTGLPASERLNYMKNQVENLQRAGYTVPAWYANPNIKTLASPSEIVKLLVKSGAKINNKNKKGETPLIAALGDQGDTRSEVIMALLNNGADFNIESPEYGSPLVAAAGHGLTNVIELILAKGGNINKLSKIDFWQRSGNRINNVSPLMWAARNGRTETVKFLLLKGANTKDLTQGSMVDKKSNCLISFKDASVLFFAVASGDVQLVKYLLENKAKTFSTSVTIEPWQEGSAKGLLWGNTVKVSCLTPGPHKLSAYAKICTYNELSDYLLSKKL